jgi:hypothetical protein
VTTAEAAWGSCPECDAAITESMAFCKACGFPLKPVQKTSTAPPPPAPPPARSARTTTRMRKRRRGGKGKALLEPGEEAPGAMLFAVFGLVVPILAFLALALSRRGSSAYRLAWAGIGLWILTTLFIISRMHG